MDSETEYNYITPKHYTLWKDNNDVFNVIKSTLTASEWLGFVKGNILKYQLRLGKKPGEAIEKDIKKIKEYQKLLV